MSTQTQTMNRPAITEKQTELIEKLLTTQKTTPEIDAWVREALPRMHRTLASNTIERLIALGSKITDGWFLLDGDVIKVQHNRAHTRFYAKRLVVVDGHGSWEYEPGLVNQMGAAAEMTEEQAADFGKLYGVCFRCGLELTNEESISRGYGPICAGKMGW